MYIESITVKQDLKIPIQQKIVSFEHHQSQFIKTNKHFHGNLFQSLEILIISIHMLMILVGNDMSTVFLK